MSTHSRVLTIEQIDKILAWCEKELQKQEEAKKELPRGEK